MKGYDPKDALAFIVAGVDQKEFRGIAPKIPFMIEAFIIYDLHFMRLTGVLDENDDSGENEYDDDEAFDYIFDAYLSDQPCDDDAAMQVASLLNAYMELQYEYLKQKGLA